MRERRTGEYVGAAFGNIVALVLVNLVPVFRHLAHGVVLESWFDILWAADLSVLLQIVGYLVLTFYRPRWFEAFMRMLFAAAGLLSTLVFYLVFPVDFSVIDLAWLNTVLRVCLAVGIVASIITAVVQLVRFLTAGLHRVEA